MPEVPSVRNVSSSTSRVLGNVRRSMVSELDGQKNRAADRLARLASTVERLTEEMGPARTVFGPVAENAGSRLHRVAEGIRERPIPVLANDLARFARRRPVVFVSAAFLLGLVVGRALVQDDGVGPGAGTMDV